MIFVDGCFIVLFEALSEDRREAGTHGPNGGIVENTSTACELPRCTARCDGWNRTAPEFSFVNTS